MDFSEYRKIIENTHATQRLKYRLAVVWLHPEKLPLSVVAAGGCTDKVIRVPHTAENRYGIRVPVLSVDSGTFKGNTEVTDIILGSGIDKIDAGAFSGCSALERITIPRAVKRIGAGTFADCTSLTDVYYEGTPEEWAKVDIVTHKRETVYGELAPGAPVQRIVCDKLVPVPGNEALSTATIHFRCTVHELKE